jgi:hypothetical protein
MIFSMLEQFVVDTDVLVTVEKAGQMAPVSALGRLPVVITDTVWAEFANPQPRKPAALTASHQTFLRTIAGAATVLTPQSPEAAPGCIDQGRAAEEQRQCHLQIQDGEEPSGSSLVVNCTMRWLKEHRATGVTRARSSGLAARRAGCGRRLRSMKPIRGGRPVRTASRRP